MKKQVLEKIAKLLAANNQDVRKKLKGELYNLIPPLPRDSHRVIYKQIKIINKDL
jgi:hypothetical protein